MSNRIIVKYKTFNTSEEFELYQIDNGIRVVTVQPLPTNVDSDFNENESMDMNIDYAVFVTYTEEPAE